MQENKEMIEELSGVPVLGLLPELPKGFTRDELLRVAEGNIAISNVEELIKQGSTVESSYI